MQQIKMTWRRQWIIKLLLIILALGCSSTVFAFDNIAFYYGNNIPWDELHAFDAIVVQPNVVHKPKPYQRSNSQLFAYVSMGEASPGMHYYKAIKPAWILTKNAVWHTSVINVASEQWQHFFLQKVIAPLWKAGYRNFFFDNLDSYQLASLSPTETLAEQQGLITLIKAIKYQHPQAKIILNRGFEILPKVHQDINGVAAESLFYGLNQQHQYIAVPDAKHQQLLRILQNIHQQYQLPVIVIDFLPPQKRQQAREVAKKIQQLGFIPWVTDKDLRSVGVSNIEVIPRKILVLYDANQHVPNIAYSNALRFGGFPLEYMGYSPIYQNVSLPLPSDILSGRYAGILVWLTDEEVGKKQHLDQWLLKQVADNIPVAFLDHFGFPMTANDQKLFHIAIKEQQQAPTSLHIRHEDKQFINFETASIMNRYQFKLIQAKQARVLLQIEDGQQQLSDPVAITSWGGYALAPYVTRQFPNDESRWILSPFPFFRQSLRLDHFPIPDVTTENGRRLLLVHIDGDGFVSGAEWYGGSHAGEETEKRILNVYKIPTTVSVIQGELSPDGSETEKNKEFFATARRIFNMPWVEIATHAYSHPFKWRELEEKKSGKGLNLQIPGYQFSWYKELRGSADFIDDNLAPANKKTKMILWTGDCNPSDKGIAEAYRYGLYNMNFGDTLIASDRQSLTNIAPLGVWKGNYYQVFAPNQNENVYTNDWTGPFYGFERVIETFKLTDQPHRYKPINIYYHFYSVSKKSAYRALKKVYDYAMSQPTLDIFSSEYAQKVLDWQHMVIAKDNDGWLIRDNNTLRELRIPQSMGYPNLTRSKNIIGYFPYNQDYYIHLGPAKQSLLFLQKKAPTIPYLYDANGFVTAFKRKKRGLELSLKSYMPLEFSLANAKHCELKQNGKILVPINKKSSTIEQFKLNSKQSHALTLSCPSA